MKDYVNEQLFERGKLAKLADIAKVLATFQERKKIEIRGADARSVKSRLTKCYGSKVSFIQKKPGTPEFIYATDVNIENNNEPDISLMSDTEKVKFISNLIRNEINKQYNENKIFSTWPPVEEEIKSDKVVLPHLRTTFLHTILSSSAASPRVTRLIKSIGQHIVYNSSNGRIKTIKHVQLSLITKRKTGSKFLVNCLNRLGHCISDDQVNNIETFFC